MRAITLAMGVGLLARIACADAVAAKTTYTQVCGPYVFVMLGEGPLAERDTVPFPRSGLYRNDGSRAPLWTVDWYAHEVNLLPDASRLVRWGPWASATRDEAISFFAGPKMLKTYAVGDVVTLPWVLPRTVSHFWWCKKRRFDVESRQLTIWTHDGNQIVFSLDSGEELSRRSVGRRVICGAVAVGVVAMTLLAWWYGRRRRAATPGV